MATIAQAQLHRIYLVKQYGDTLVVTPKGDAAGFSVSSVNSEIQVVKALSQADSTKHLIIDLSSGNYFGSVVLGAVIQLGTSVRERGGRIAMAAPSSDMQDILRLLKVDQMWELFPDLKSALRSIAKIPLGERMWAQRYVLLTLALVAAAIVGYQFMPRIRYGRQYYRVTNELWQEVEARRELAGEEEWRQLVRKCEARLEPILKEIEVTMKRRRLYDAEPFVLYAIRDHWDAAMERRPIVSNEGDRMLIQFYLRCAEARLADRPLPVRFDAARGDTRTKTAMKKAAEKKAAEKKGDPSSVEAQNPDAK